MMSPEEWHKRYFKARMCDGVQKSLIGKNTTDDDAYISATGTLSSISMVDKPPHYNKSKIEAIEYIQDTLGEGFTYYLEGNIKKYLHRFRYKNGKEDLKKAEWYLKKLIETYKD